MRPRLKKLLLDVSGQLPFDQALELGTREANGQTVRGGLFGGAQRPCEMACNNAPKLSQVSGCITLLQLPPVSLNHVNANVPGIQTHTAFVRLFQLLGALPCDSSFPLSSSGCRLLLSTHNYSPQHLSGTECNASRSSSLRHTLPSVKDNTRPTLVQDTKKQTKFVWCPTNGGRKQWNYLTSPTGRAYAIIISMAAWIKIFSVHMHCTYHANAKGMPGEFNQYAQFMP